MQLRNKQNRRLLKLKIEQDHTPRITLSFYKYAHIPNPELFRNTLYQKLSALEVLGRIYVSKEGINAQISVPEEKFEYFKTYINSLHILKGERLNIAIEQSHKSFFVLDIKVRNKIVADGLDDSSFDVTNTGKHLKAKEFNELCERPDSVVVDMRNHYEHEVGHFKGAILPDVDTFREALQKVESILQEHRDKHILLYCTGGIRCEKASAYLKHKGFEKVYQLEGGIIEYARQVKALGLENKFIGKNFVFDERLGERITDDIISSCHQCGKPCDNHTNCANDACHLLFIQCDDCKKKFEGCCSSKCKEIIHLSPEEQKAIRKGMAKGRQVFHKGRVEFSPLEKINSL
ncbi:MAG: rhodanese-related sulfurtransferase [Chitinophagales bacterium]|nr:rhodanese-related sulfurtransferase [Chitinophagales bacterium]MDW8274407.1 rhodanese-related sulfurtransferase [Chitinophagales bacterium]